MKTKTVILPSNYNDELVSMAHLHGLLDHECAHILWTDPSISQSFVEEDGKSDSEKFILHSLWNVIEDIWIEKRMSEKYIGCAQNLRVVNEWLYEAIGKRWSELDALGRLAFALEQCVIGEKTVVDFAGDEKIGGLLPSLQAEIDRGKGCASSTEALGIARSIYEKIKELAKGEFDARPNGIGGYRSNDVSQLVCGTDGISAGHSGDEDSVETSKNRSDSSEGESKSMGSDSIGANEGSEQAQEFLRRQGDFVKPLDVEGLVNEHQTHFPDWSTHRDPDQYLVYTQEYDFDTTYSADQRDRCSSEYFKLREKIQPLIGSLARALELGLVTETESRWVPGARRGRKFDRRRLNRWVGGSDDDRLWCYREGGESIDTAVTMLWDCSGSMGGSRGEHTKAALARLAAIAFHEALNHCRSYGVEHEVLGFNTTVQNSVEIKQLVSGLSVEDLKIYSRVEELDARMVFVPWGQVDGRAIVNITGAGCNRDGECVLWAAKRLAARSEKRKVLIVGADGHPQGARYHRTEKNYLREIVQRIVGAGIEVHALGIMDKAVQEYYPSWEYVDKPEDLPRAVMRQLMRRLGDFDAA
jgi:hypothetical protein